MMGFGSRLRFLSVVSGLTICAIGFLVSGAMAVEYRYTKFNIHYQEKGTIRASYANWTDPGAGHGFFPPNTEVAVEEPYGNSMILRLKNGRNVYFYYSVRNMNMKATEYFEMITSPTPVSLDGFSEIDMKGIEEGKALPGMTKEGVMTALGYPAAHYTPSLEANTWYFWRNRWGKTRVVFDDNGVVKAIE